MIVKRFDDDGHVLAIDVLHEHGGVTGAGFRVGDDLVQGELDVCGGERFTVVPGDAFTQVEGVDQAVVTDVPAGGQAGDEIVSIKGGCRLGGARARRDRD